MKEEVNTRQGVGRRQDLFADFRHHHLVGTKTSSMMLVIGLSALTQNRKTVLEHDGIIVFLAAFVFCF